jgi:hypothetical protein
MNRIGYVQWNNHKGVVWMGAVNAVFRTHPELEPTGKVSLLGASLCSADRMDAYAKRRNPDAPELAECYLRLGRRYGIRGDVAYCQMVYETRGWTAQVSGPYWEPLLLGQWAEEAAIERVMQILYSFATQLPLPVEFNQVKGQAELLDRASWRGKVAYWEDLSGKWTKSGQHYGQDIVAMWRNMMEWNGKGEVKHMETFEQSEHAQGSGSKPLDRPSLPGARRAGNVEESLRCTEEMLFLKQLGLLPSPVPHPDREVTWAELAVLLQRWEYRSVPATMEGNGAPLREEGE